MSGPAVSVVVRCRNEARDVGAVIDAVRAQRDAPPAEILALDSGSTDGTLDVLASRGVHVEHLPAREFSFGRALNVGARLARGELLVHLSAHCPPQSSSWLAALVAPFAAPDVVATFGRQVPVPGANPYEALTQALMFPATPPSPIRFSNANGAARRAAVLVEPFDEDIPAAEDHLWATQVSPPGRIVYVPDAVVAHSHPMGWREWRHRFYINGVAAAVLARRGVAPPWSDGGGRAAALRRLVTALAAGGHVRALALLPVYALARTVWYARGLRAGRQAPPPALHAGAAASGA